MKGTPHGKPMSFLLEAMDSYTDDCIRWPFAAGGAVRKYAKITVNGRLHSAHRYICELVNGEPPSPEHEAAHSCGNSICVNWKHLSWKTKKENSQDKIRHGTVPIGEKHPLAKLKNSDIPTIILLSKSMTYTDVGKMFGVSRHRIRDVVTGKNWSSVSKIKSEHAVVGTSWSHLNAVN